MGERSDQLGWRGWRGLARLLRRRLEILQQGSAGDEVDPLAFAIAMMAKCTGELFSWDYMEVSGAAFEAL